MGIRVSKLFGTILAVVAAGVIIGVGLSVLIAQTDAPQYWAVVGGIFAVASAAIFAFVDSSEAAQTPTAADYARLAAHGLAIVASLIAFGLLFNITA